MDEIINETLDDESTESLDDETTEPLDEGAPETNLDSILSEISRLSTRIEELSSAVEEMLAPIRTFAQKDLPEANTNKESAPALYYL